MTVDCRRAADYNSICCVLIQSYSSPSRFNTRPDIAVDWLQCSVSFGIRISRASFRWSSDASECGGELDSSHS